MKGRIRRIFLTRAWKNLSKRLEKNILSFEVGIGGFGTGTGTYGTNETNVTHATGVWDLGRSVGFCGA
jgi:hypothetical protein